MEDEFADTDGDIAEMVKEYALDLSNAEEDRQKLKRLFWLGSKALTLQLLDYSDSHAEKDRSNLQFRNLCGRHYCRYCGRCRNCPGRFLVRYGCGGAVVGGLMLLLLRKKSVLTQALFFIVF